MADQSRGSNLEEDPLHAYSGLSVFSRTLKSLSNPLPPNYQSDDLQQTHTLLEYMPFEVQQEHQEQAKAILDDSSGLFKQGLGDEDTNEGMKMNPILNKRERRPGLDRKRGHFTFKPTISQPPQNEPTFDASKYPKPDDYFAALERHQKAKREWQKQSGIVVTDALQNQPSRRPRRPGMPGRRRASYKNTYTDSYFTDLKASQKENPIPSEQKSLERTTAAHVTATDREVDDSTVDEEQNLKNILTALLSCSPDELEGDAGVKLMEERLHIKPVDKEMLSFPVFPEFPDVGNMDLKASGRNPSNQRTALSNIQNLPKGINSDATRKNSQPSSSNPPEGHISVPDRQYLVPGDRQSREVDLAKDFNACFRSSVANNADEVITNASASNLGTTYVASDFNSSVQKSSREDGSDTHSGVHRSHLSPDLNADNCVDDSITNRNLATPEVNVDLQTEGNEVDVPMSESEVNRNTGIRESDAGINEETEKLDNLAEYASGEAARMDPFTVEEDNIPDQQDESSKSPNRALEQDNTMDGSVEHAEHIQGQHVEENDNKDTACEVQVENAQEIHSSSQKQTSEGRKRRGSCDSNTKKRSKTVHDESQGDKQTKTLSLESGAKKQTKRKSNEREEKKKQMKKVTREGKMFSRRKSLAGAGTKWDSGVRRSTRIKSRPLEYWRGERFLFGRIHESLTTVIGVKQASPDKGKREKQRVLKVTSFVSDDYKELIDLAALH